MKAPYRRRNELEDRAIGGGGGATIAGHTCKVVLVGPGAPDLAAQARLAGRAAPRPEAAAALVAAG